jgi:asparagine synthase (glutamine-hydrolysing)
MPGLVGLITARPAPEAQALVGAMIRPMLHERFYVSGQHAAPDLGVFGGWVALAEAGTARQPLANPSGDITLLFSGECVRDDRPARGDHGAPSPDWLVPAYEKEGAEFVDRLNGLFSGLLVDRRARQVLLFNDRYGFDRLYYHDAGREFYFASEAAALLEVLPHLREFDREGVGQYLAVGCTLPEQTLFKGLRCLPPAALWSFQEGRRIERRYFSPGTWETQPVLSANDYQARFASILSRVVPRYFAGPQPIGMALTAGLDSRMVLAARPRPAADTAVCYTYGGEAGQMLDTRLAGRVAAACGLPHHVLRIERDFFTGFSSFFDRTIRVTSGYFGLLGTHEVYFNQRARELAKVRLTGVCGGEILRHVCTFKPMGLETRLLTPDLAATVAERAASFAAERLHPVTFAAFREIPLNIHGTLAACRSQVTFRTPFLDNELVALAYQAAPAVRGSSDSAVRFIAQADPSLAAVPTDMGLLGTAGGMTTAARRLFARMTFKADYLANDGLPGALSFLDPLLDWGHRRVGLPGLHKFLWYRRWFRRELSGWLREQLADSSVRQMPFWNHAWLGGLADRHVSGRQNLVAELNAVITLAGIQRLLLRPH